ncbi:PREDICTED: uncharacterized protein LOC107191805 [Dufourea novaeangliae]|nr:PREDICTED: uncharacterized protein LOC107191805 [Dufourea novaeangliae]
MKITAILLCALSFVCYTMVQADEVMPPSCLEQAGVQIVDIPALLRDQTEEGSRKRACIAACYLQKMGLMNGNAINLELIDARIDKIMQNSDEKENLRQSIHECVANAAQEDECMVAQMFMKCGIDRLRLPLHNLLDKFYQ